LTYFDQCKGLTTWRHSDPDAAGLPVRLQRATLKLVDEAFLGYFRRVKVKGKKAGFPRFRGKRWDSFGFTEFRGISFDGARLRFKGIPGALKVHLHRPLPAPLKIRSCTFKRDLKGWKVGFAMDVPVTGQRDGQRSVGVDLGIATFAALSDGGFIPSLRAARHADRRLRVAQRRLTRKRSGSKSRQEARTRVARCHATVARARENYLHQASARLI
jgi:putative transposase